MGCEVIIVGYKIFNGMISIIVLPHEQSRDIAMCQVAFKENNPDVIGIPCKSPLLMRVAVVNVNGNIVYYADIITLPKFESGYRSRITIVPTQGRYVMVVGKVVRLVLEIPEKRLRLHIMRN